MAHRYHNNNIINYEQEEAQEWKQPKPKQPNYQKKNVINYEEEEAQEWKQPKPSYQRNNLINYEEEEAQEYKQPKPSYQRNNIINYEEEGAQEWKQQPNYQRKNIINYEEEDAQEWKQSSHLKNQRIDEIADNASNTPFTLPDEVWLMPVMDEGSNVSHRILGLKQDNLKRIEKATNTHMKYNEKEAKVEMWGIRKDLDEALRQWNAIANNVMSTIPKKKTWNREEDEKNEQQNLPMPKSTPRLVEPAWAKPDKAPRTKKEKKKLERREERKLKEDAFKEFPKDRYPFRGHFVFPNTDIPIDLYFGDNILDPLRIETKCHIWHEPTPANSGYYLMKIDGNSYESVEEATARVRNLFIKVYLSRAIPSKGWIYHMIDPPYRPCRVKIVDPSPLIYLPYKNAKFLELEPVEEGSSSDFNDSQRIRESNNKRFKDALTKAFETVHLFDCEIKWRIRFGHVCLTTYPNPDKGDQSWSIGKLNEKVLKSPRVQSEFSTCITTDDRQLDRLIEVLSESKTKWIGSPFREFKICAIRTFITTSKETKDRRDKEKQDIPCVFAVQFNKSINNSKEDGEYEGKFGLWKVTIHEKTVLGISMVHLENDYSWKLNIQTAKRLPNEDAQDVQRQFVSTLRICPEGRLVYSNTKGIKVVSVCEKTRWKYWWKDDYVVEVTKYEFWDLTHNKNASSVLELHLNQEDRPKVTFGVSLYKKSWDDDFAVNGSLGVGEEPEWHPHDILDEELTGGVDALLSDIQTFLDILQSSHPIKTEFISDSGENIENIPNIP